MITSCQQPAVSGPHPQPPAEPQRCTPIDRRCKPLFTCLLAAVLVACGARDSAPAAPAAAARAEVAVAGSAASAASAASVASAPPVSVTLVRALARDFTLTLEASGTVAALSSVEVKSQVSAQVLAVHVKEGQFVARGAPLFTLDARVDAANLKKAEAQLLKDEATLADARRQLTRSQELLAQNFISRGAVDTAQANVDGQQAVVAADRAAIDAVKAQLSYSRIAAPSAGRVGQILVFAGSSVSPGGAAMLTLTQIDPVAVAFSLPQRNLGEALAALGRAAAPAASGATAKASRPDSRGWVTAVLPDGQGSRQGQLIFVDSTVDAASGTVKAKAQFANADQALWPGAYVTVKMAVQTLPDAIVVPQAAIVQGARGTTVFVAGPGNAAAIRPVKILASAGTDAVVSGLKAGERVVLDGRQNVRPGTTLIERAADSGRGGSGAAGGAGRAGSAPSGAASGPPGAAASTAPNAATGGAGRAP